MNENENPTEEEKMWTTAMGVVGAIKDATITQLRAQLSASQKEAKLWELRVSESAACAENWEKWAHDYHAQLAESQTKVKNWEIEYTAAMAQGVQFIDSLRAQLAESQKETAILGDSFQAACDEVAALKADNKALTVAMAAQTENCTEWTTKVQGQIVTVEAERDAEIETRIECNRKLTSIFGILMSEQGA
jgi:chromosome segregation ATPase